MGGVIDVTQFKQFETRPRISEKERITHRDGPPGELKGFNTKSSDLVKFSRPRPRSHERSPQR